ncbi:MAG TPA: HAD family phosphatase [Candidatus Omnitrophota bacterium]|nr:HAD family phosphatase [Candidatus Omnitrophota bacterium]HPT38834.1 HAD family phosphatase [Candidatus Omnitrophota bacterium]
MAKEIKVVLFDLGRVLVDFDPLRAARRIAEFCPKTPQEIFDLFLGSELTNAFEAGKITPEDFYFKVKQMLDLKLSYNSFEPIWNDIFFLSAKNRSVFGLANSLRANYKTVLLSNINILHHEYLKKNFPVFGAFDKIFLSYQLGLIKPEKAIYDLVIRDLGVNPEEIFYTDDRPELVESARALGICACVFGSFNQLISDLKKNGIVFAANKNHPILVL